MPATPTATPPPAPLPINVATETLLSLSQAAKRFPPFRQGRPVSASTVWRWAFDGVVITGGSRVRLDVVRLGGRWLTSVEAIGRFIAAQTPTPAAAEAARALGTRTPRQRQRAAERAEQELSRRGI